MKKLNKLQINPEKLMNSKELIALRGGTQALKCIRSWIWGGDCYFEDDPAYDCNDYSSVRLFCGMFCFMSDASICVGGSY